MEQISMFTRDPTAAYSHNNKQSYEAHKSVKNTKQAQLNKIFACILGSSRGRTCDEVEAILGISHQAASARFVELKATNRIKQSGTRKTRSGRKAGVWIA